MHPGDNDSAPKAFVSILFLDRNYNFLDMAFDQMTTAGEQTSPTVKQPPHDLLSIAAKAPESGYAYVFISNEHSTYVDVYFDDVSVSHTPSPIVSSSDYYPFGLSFNSGQLDGSVDQKYLYNGKELQDELSLNWYDYGARMYMPEIGRWGVADPLADKAHSWTPYRYSFNNPIMFIDPDGRYEVNIGYGQKMDHRDVSGSIEHYGAAELSDRDIEIMNGQAAVAQVREIGKEWSKHIQSNFGTANVADIQEKFIGWVFKRMQDQSPSHQGDPIIFVSFSVLPKDFNKNEYFKQLKSTLVENGFSSSLQIKEYSMTGKLKAWWNKSPTGTITFTNHYGNMPMDAGGHALLNNPNSVIIYPGLDGRYGQANLDTWLYVNATLHEIGHGFFGFDHDASGNTFGPPSVMDYRYAYDQGMGFNLDQRLHVAASAWSNQ